MPNENVQIINADTQTRRFITGPASNGPVELEFYQGDTHTLLLRGWVQSDLAPLGQIYIPAPISYSEMAAGLFAGSPDAPPLDGTFKLRYEGQTTGELKWNIGKGELAAVLNALSTVTSAGGLKVLENGPAHFYTIQWNDGDPGASIEAVEVKLSPVCLVRIKKNTIVNGQVLIKLVRAPLAYTEDFEYPTPPEIILATVRTGNSQRNEIQSLKIPDGATGEFALIWNSTATQVVQVASATSAEIARVLNELYTDTVTRFAVTNPGRNLFYIEFVGPLAKADQPDLDFEMYSQTAVQAPRFKLPITAEVPVDLELLARENIPIVFEVAAWNGAEKTVIAQQSVKLINNAIDSELGIDLAESGAVQIITNTVYIDESEGEPFITVALGAAYTPSEPGEEVVINHTKNTFQPKVSVHLKISSDPEKWVQIPDDEYEAEATSANHVKVTGIHMDADPDSEEYFENWKIYVASPDATATLLTHDHNTDDIVRIVDGEPVTLSVILDELMSSLPTDWPNVPANKIGGTILASQLDITGIANALQSNARFVTTLREVLKDATIISTIATELRTNSEFSETIKTVLASESVVESLVETLKESNSYHDFVRETVLQVLQGTGGVLPDGSVLFSVPSFEIAVPAPKSIPAASEKVSVISDVEIQTEDSNTAGSAEFNAKKSGTLRVVKAKETATAFNARETIVYDYLSPLIPVSYVTLGTVASKSTVGTEDVYTFPTLGGAPVPAVGDYVFDLSNIVKVTAVSVVGGNTTVKTAAGALLTEVGDTLRIFNSAGVSGVLATEGQAKLNRVTAIAQARTAGPRRGRTFKPGAEATYANGHYYEVRVDTTDGMRLAAKEMEHTIFQVEVSGRMWKEMSSFAAQWVIAAALVGNVVGSIDICVEVSSRANGNFNSSWINISRVNIPLSDAVAFHQFELNADHGELSSTGSFAVYGEEMDLDMTAFLGGFAIRVRTANFDCELPEEGARGCLQLKCPSPNVSITPIEVEE